MKLQDVKMTDQQDVKLPDVKMSDWFAAERRAVPAVDRYPLRAPALSSKCGQRHVESRGTRFITDLMGNEMALQFGSNSTTGIWMGFVGLYKTFHQSPFG